MNFVLIKIQLLHKSLKNRGIKNTMLIAFSHYIDKYFDIKHKTDTSTWIGLDDLMIDDSKKKHAERYQQTYAVPLRRLFLKLKFPPGKIFVDFGCGKGRVLLIASEFGFNEVRGIELSPVLCDFAIENNLIYKKKTQTKTDFIIINSDVIDYQFDDNEEVFFLYDPFDGYVMKQVVQNILESLQRQKRKIWIIYRNARFGSIIEQIIDVKRVLKFFIWGQDFVVYEVEQGA
ncbi:class I SAM-dependent methyltransferase [Desulfococcaceae bacterium HSG7]|nr:class I SAM-dependent methyltransferase [Desulfococcaceae bacterium HSG7]